jgi:quercetin dioxygenase-like cupin family protein
MMAPKEIIHIGQLEIRFLLDGDDTADSLVMFELLVPPGARVPAPHYHERVDETAYGLDGVLDLTVSGRRIEIGPGARCFIPRGAVHQFLNAGLKPSRTLFVLSPALIGPAYFRDIAALLANGPPDPAQMAEIMHRHGLIVVPQSA